ncbi:MAG: hypothetical protein Q4A15_02405, partial [Prevotellaceae bacterium]|nr:hypothetical protein [Prevotellaceae bacterium]
MKTLLSIIFVLVNITVFAQKSPVTQHDWSIYEGVDTCTARYAVVHDWYGRCGIYNLEKHENITELEYRQLKFSGIKNLEDGNQATVFYGKKGVREGVVAVGPDDNVMELTLEDEDMFYSLDSCTSIDKRIDKFARKLLKNELESKDNKGAMYGQILVMDTKTAQIKAWVAMADEYGNGKFEETRLRKYQCSTMPIKIIQSIKFLVDANLTLEDCVDIKQGLDTIGGLVIKDNNWKHGKSGRVTYREAFKQHSSIAMSKAWYATDSIASRRFWHGHAEVPRGIDAMYLAAAYNVIATGVLIDPSVNSNSVTLNQEEEIGLEEKHISMIREILKEASQEEGVVTKKHVDLVGDYSTHYHCIPTLYDDNVGSFDKYHNDDDFQTYDQNIFVGYLPSVNPRY